MKNALLLALALTGCAVEEPDPPTFSCWVDGARVSSTPVAAAQRDHLTGHWTLRMVNGATREHWPRPEETCGRDAGEDWPSVD